MLHCHLDASGEALINVVPVRYGFRPTSMYTYRLGTGAPVPPGGFDGRAWLVKRPRRGCGGWATGRAQSSLRRCGTCSTASVSRTSARTCCATCALPPRSCSRWSSPPSRSRRGKGGAGDSRQPGLNQNSHRRPALHGPQRWPRWCVGSSPTVWSDAVYASDDQRAYELFPSAGRQEMLNRVMPRAIRVEQQVLEA